ncbi:MAG: hypothetical protein AMQ74_01933 [Candidatus Methanofastidiosum methylothiophilum]|uniref:Uncharacterized protein n=1 Tax=Candidatus Methanofastidiosum methylothiophilum TaxID=1705564 RepID=A0A150III4_9EURY|nr:MAG: hypothetical protein AMQ74_01933 [Candidatus Methanofastidiosum methylthiophilus]
MQKIEEKAIEDIRNEEEETYKIGGTTKSRTVFSINNKGGKYVDKDFPMGDLSKGAQKALNDRNFETEVWVDEEITDADEENCYYTTYTYINSTNKNLEEGSEEYQEIVNIVDEVYNEVDWEAD